MPQFSMIPERARILEKIPDYAVTSEPLDQTVRILYQGTVVAESSEALLVKETKHADVVYMPRDALDMSYFSPTDHSTYCPFKGHANYWSVAVETSTDDNIAWSYDNPYPEVAQLKDYVSFYTDRTSMELS